VIENRPLARGLHDAVTVGQEVPSRFYRAVAEVLAFVYSRAGAGA
jgi:flagellar biosynthetic protein FlhB